MLDNYLDLTHSFDNSLAFKLTNSSACTTFQVIFIKKKNKKKTFLFAYSVSSDPKHNAYKSQCSELQYPCFWCVCVHNNFHTVHR